MVRTQVQLTEDQVQALRRIAAASGRSIAGVIREGVDLYLGGRRRPNRKEQIERALRVAGRFASGRSDVSSQHDRYLSEAFRS
jgi:hypothetical protein